MDFPLRKMFVLVGMAWFMAGVSLSLARVSPCLDKIPEWSRETVVVGAANAALWPIGDAVRYAVYILQVKGAFPTLPVAWLPYCAGVALPSLALGAAANGLFWAVLLTSEFVVVRGIHRRLTRRRPPPAPSTEA